MKLQFADPGFVRFSDDELDDSDEMPEEPPTLPRLEPAPVSTRPAALVGLVEYASEVRIRAAERADRITHRRRMA